MVKKKLPMRSAMKSTASQILPSMIRALISVSGRKNFHASYANSRGRDTGTDKKLMKDQALAEFNLAGGTALSLMIGHRKSIDIDLFSPIEFDAVKLASHLSTFHNTVNIQDCLNK
jgi:hypothetical protein